ncbi:thioesterase II family protein [Streptosporangium sandarakinum]|uniref:thioesterase II family protein n=1 Tax=Streptosporangium sandarakinum TaxID=1260955 RepID=UPI0034121D0B
MVTQPSWYLAFEPRPAARVHLYGLPFAGGGVSMFRPWARHLPPWVELRAVRLPGRPGRHRQAPFTDCEEAARWLADALAESSAASSAASSAGSRAGDPVAGAVPYAVFGHSMGALLGYRLTRALLRDGAPPPALLALAAWPVRGAAAALTPDPADPDDRFAATLRSLGGLPPEMADDPDALALTLPVARADFTLCRSYAYRAEPPLPVPVTVFGGTGDAVAPPGELAEWRAHTRDFLGLRLFEGGHFFPREHLPELAAALTADLARVLGRPGPASRRDPVGTASAGASGDVTPAALATSVP